MNKLKEYQFLRKETEKLNHFLFGPSSYEHSLQSILNKNSICTKDILNLARTCDNKIKRYVSNPIQNQTLHKK